MTEAKTPTVHRIEVIPQLDKYGAVGRAVGQFPRSYRVHNEIFDGKTIHLAGARGEVVGFQALIKGKGDVIVTCNVPGMRVDRFRAIYVPSKVGRIPDPLITFEKLTLSPDEATPVFVDVYVPFGFEGRDVKGVFRISDGRELPIELRVRNFSLPKRASFFCEMNGYGLPNRMSEFMHSSSLLTITERTSISSLMGTRRPRPEADGPGSACSRTMACGWTTTGTTRSVQARSRRGGTISSRFSAHISRASASRMVTAAPFPHRDST